MSDYLDARRMPRGWKWEPGRFDDRHGWNLLDKTGTAVAQIYQSEKHGWMGGNKYVVIVCNKPNGENILTIAVALEKLAGVA
jgi:hypothetical protein